MADESHTASNEHTVPRHVYEGLKREYDQLTEAYATLDGEHTDLKGKLAQFEEAGLDVKKTTKRLQDLERKVRTRSHGDGLRGLAKELGLDEDFIEDVLELSRWPIDADEPDLKAMKKHVGEFLERKPRYKRPKEEGAEGEGEAPTEWTETRRKPLKTEEEGRGAAAAPSAYFSYRGRDLSDAEWMLKHGREYSAAVASGTARRVGD